MDATTDDLRWFFQQPPPRQVDGELFDAALDVLFPRMLRVLFYILPIFMLSIVGVILAILIQNTDLRTEWRLMTEHLLQTAEALSGVSFKSIFFAGNRPACSLPPQP